MALLRYAELNGDNDSFSIGKNSPVEVAGIETSWQAASAMRVFLPAKESMPVLYGEEEQIMYGGWRSRRLSFSESSMTSIERLECKVETSHLTIKKRHEIALAEFPYSTCATGSGRFKPPFKQSIEKKPQPDRALSESRDALVKWLQELKWDYWEKDSRLTATIEMKREFPDFSWGVRTPFKQSGVALGVCEDMQQACTWLSKCEKAQKIIEQTLQGRRRFWFRKDSMVVLNDEVVEHAESILNLSIQQALSGPYSTPDSGRLCNTEVIDRAGEIYNQHLNRLNKQVSKKTRPLRDTRFDDQSFSSDMSEDASELDESVVQRIADNYQVSIQQAQSVLSFLEVTNLFDSVVESGLLDRVFLLFKRVFEMPSPSSDYSIERSRITELLVQDPRNLEASIDAAENLLARIAN